MAPESTAERRWAEALEAWAIPAEILAQAPQSPYGHDPGRFARRAQAEVAAAEPTPSRLAALDALPPGGTVLDVGAGAGAASLPLVPRAGGLTAVDPSPGMLDAYAEQARAVGRSALLVAARWPAAAGIAPRADVVVCHHVVHDVAAIGPFVDALSAHAIRRVVLEMRADHPLAWMNPLWERFWSLPRPNGPGPAELADVLTERGITAHVEPWEAADDLLRAPGSTSAEEAEEAVSAALRRLCLGEERRDEVREALAQIPPDATRRLAAVWWDAG
jgi:SAM-dependent methyltransferase